MLDQTPILDISPQVPVLDARGTERTGWFSLRVTQLSGNGAGQPHQLTVSTDDPRSVARCSPRWLGLSGVPLTSSVRRHFTFP